MKISSLFFLGFGLSALPAAAQQVSLRGVAVATQGNIAVEAANVRLMKPADSTIVAAGMTNAEGQFSLNAPAGQYRLHITSIGFAPYTHTLTLSAAQPELLLDTIRIRPTTELLGMAEVTHTIARVEQSADTTVFNAGAYRIPESSNLESLIAQLPGVVVQDDGTIKWNGKTVTEFLTNGKDFFKGNTNVAMKNVPANLVSKVKAYDRKSDFTQQTGIDDGEETTVLDLTLKRELNETVFANIDLAGGTQDRYASKLFANYFNDKIRITGFGGMNNTGDRGFMGGPGMARFGGGGAGAASDGAGMTAMKSAGADFVWDNGKKRFEAGRIETGGDVRLSYADVDLISEAVTERFLTDGTSSSFGNNFTRSDRRNITANINLRLHWSPDSMTSLSIRPEFAHRHGSTRGLGSAATFSSNPYELGANPLDALLAGHTTYHGILVNTNGTRQLGNTLSNEGKVNLNVTRRLNTKGRSLSLFANAGFTHSYSRNFSHSDIKYYNTTAATDRFTNQYTYQPNRTWNYAAQLSYTEPITRQLLVQARYQYSHSHSNTERNLYALDSLPHWGSSTLHPIGTLPTTADSLMLAYNLRNSNRADYDYHTHRTALSLNYYGKGIWAQVGVELLPQYTALDYLYQGSTLRVTRHVVNFAPNVRINYRPSEQTNLRANYRGRASQPSITNLLDITDDSNPLYIVTGNPELKPSWTHSADFSFNTYNTESQRSWSAHWQFAHTSNATANRTFYNTTTGVTTTKPVNVSGNWNTSVDFTYNTPLTREKRFTLSNNLRSGYQQTVGFVTQAAIADAGVRSATCTINAYDKLTLNFRRDTYDIALFGSIDYRNTRNALYTAANMNTYAFSYGASTNISLPWSLSISTDIAMNSRRGYAEAGMNTNELMWNAKISKSFLRNNAATLSLEFFDILDQESNVSRNITAAMRTDAYNNNLGAYAMLHFTYRINFMGGTGGSKKMRSPGDRPPFLEGGSQPNFRPERPGGFRP